MLAPVDDILLGHARLRPGQRVIDVGCGRGATSHAAAAAIGPAGRVVSVDVSADMIATAKTQPVEPAAATVDWVVHDAATHRFDRAAADVVISRFGVMFFDDPVAAFTNVHEATVSDGRLAIAVWQPRDQSPFQQLAIDVATSVAAEKGLTVDAPAPDGGPFAFGVDAYVRSVLESAGWTDVVPNVHFVDFYLAGPGTTPEQAVQMGRSIGALVDLIRGLPDDVVAAIEDTMLAEYTARWDGTGIVLPGGIAVVTANA